jgi:hypothetical protein
MGCYTEFNRAERTSAKDNAPIVALAEYADINEVGRARF